MATGAQFAPCRQGCVVGPALPLRPSLWLELWVFADAAYGRLVRGLGEQGGAPRVLAPRYLRGA